VLIADPSLVLAALLLALVLDGAIGDPPALYRRLPHPVVAIGRLLGRLEARWLDPGLKARELRRRGRAACLIVVLAALVAGAGLQALCLALPLGWLWLGILMSSLVALRGLHDHIAAVARGLEAGLAEARAAVAHIVGRDPDSLDRHGVARAAIESGAENFSDGVVAPLLWGALLGLPGMLAYKAINTADSMIGHRSERYLDFGRFAARLDDLANWPAARLSGALIAAAAALLPSTDAGGAWWAMVRDARRHRSPNAGWPEAAMAGALGLRLAGPRRYGGRVVPDAWMGDGRAEAGPGDLRRALRLMLAAALLSGALLALPLAVLLFRSGCRAFGAG
jgi:adenosylcobinamide-phosphate synthase